MLLKVIIILLLILVLYCLASGLWFLAKEERGSTKLARALTWRIILSVCLFLFLIFAYFMGWIAPHGLVVVPSS